MPQDLVPELPIVLVDDEVPFLDAFTHILHREGYTNIKTFSDARKAVDFLQLNPVAGVFLDMILPDMDGKSVLKEIHRQLPQIPVVILTGSPTTENIVECMRLGAYDYQTKPIDKASLISCTRRMVDLTNVRKETEGLRAGLYRSELKNPDNFSHIISENPKMMAMFRYIESVSQTNLPVLIRGETGAGKELFAEALHKAAELSGNYCAENIASIDSGLFSATLFGYKKGAFTGANEDREGLIANAENGSLFLDEIGDLSPESQTKLLRVLQEGEYTPLGSQNKKKVKCRFILATHQPLEELVENGSFRTDLYYRIQSHQVVIPPLRNRSEDIEPLAQKFIEEAKATFQKEKLQVSAELYPLLRSFHWPGNVRQLQGMIFDAVSHSENGRLKFDRILSAMGRTRTVETSTDQSDEITSLFSEEKFPTLKEAETFLIKKAMDICQSNQTQAAKLLGIRRDALNKRLKKLNSEV